MHWCFPFCVSRDLSMNNISEIQPRAFHRLHLLSELWVRNHSTNTQFMNPLLWQFTHDKKQPFPELLTHTDLRDEVDGSGLPLISPTKLIACSNKLVDPRMAVQKKNKREPDSHSESEYMVLKYVLGRSCALHQSCCFFPPLILFQLDSSAEETHLWTQTFAKAHYGGTIEFG